MGHCPKMVKISPAYFGIFISSECCDKPDVVATWEINNKAMYTLVKYLKYRHIISNFHCYSFWGKDLKAAELE